MIASGSTKRKNKNKSARVSQSGVAGTPRISSSPNHTILSLQHNVGNHAVLNMLQAQGESKQAGNDRHRVGLEQQADYSADAIFNTPVPQVPQTSTIPEIRRSTRLPRPAGRSLSAASRAFFEPRLGCNLGAVQLHVDRGAAESAHSLQARAFTFGSDIYFGAGEFAPGTQSGKHLLAHELSHVVQQAKQGDGAMEALPLMQDAEQKQPAFDEAKWFNTFRLSAVYALSQYYLSESDVNIRQVPSFESGEDKTHPAHYNPNDGMIYFSTLGWRLNYEERVLATQGGAEKDFEDLVVEAAVEEAFHAYQNAPRQRSKAFDEYIKSVERDILFKELTRNMEQLGIPENYEKFKTTWIPHLTAKYLPESKIYEFLSENLPQMHRNPKWQLDARQEILNQWLKVLSDYYFRARSIASGIRKLSKKEPLKEEVVHRVSLIEKQASKVSKLRSTEVKLWLFAKRLESEKDPEKQLKLKSEIETLKARSNVKRIPSLEKKKEALEKEFMALGYKEDDLARSAVIAGELMELGDELDYLISLRDGIAALFKQKKWLIGTSGN